MPKGRSSNVDGRSDDDIQDEIITSISSLRFHRKFVFECKATGTRQRVTFSISGESKGEHDVYLLFISGLFGGRYNGAVVDHVAAREGVKVIIMDRPGMGGSTPVPLSKRLPVWLEMVPALLNHLNIKHVALASHSCGAIYLLNTLYYLPHVLLPSAPTVAFFAPWVHPSMSGVGLLHTASILPAKLVKRSILAIPYLNTSIVPIFQKPIAFLTSSLPKSAPKVEQTDGGPTRAQRFQTECGKSEEERDAVFTYIMKVFFAENVSGAAEEALLCLKLDGTSWDTCEDYASYVGTLAEKLRDQHFASKLSVRAIFSGKDFMIGSGGMKYFDDCWKREDIKDVISYKSDEHMRSTHDSVATPEDGQVGLFLKDLRERVVAAGGSSS